MPWCLGLLALGVVFGAMMMVAVMQTAEHWNYFWYWFSHGDDTDAARESQRKGNQWRIAMFVFFALSILCFAASCGLFMYRAPV